MEPLPSGILPADRNIEIFGDPKTFGKCLWISRGITLLFYELPLEVIDDLRDEMLSDTRAIKSMHQMGYTEEGEMLELYNYCNRGRLDNVPDITEGGKKTREFVDCGRKGRCPGEGEVCSPLVIHGSPITHRELECMRLIAAGYPYRKIMVEMGFRRITAVNSLTDRIRDKLQCSNNTEIAIKVKDMRIA